MKLARGSSKSRRQILQATAWCPAHWQKAPKRVLVLHTDRCEKSAVLSVEEGHDVGRVTGRTDDVSCGEPSRRLTSRASWPWLRHGAPFLLMACSDPCRAEEQTPMRCLGVWCTAWCPWLRLPTTYCGEQCSPFPSRPASRGLAKFPSLRKSQIAAAPTRSVL